MPRSRLGPRASLQAGVGRVQEHGHAATGRRADLPRHHRPARPQERACSAPDWPSAQPRRDRRPADHPGEIGPLHLHDPRPDGDAARGAHRELQPGRRRRRLVPDAASSPRRLVYAGTVRRACAHPQAAHRGGASGGSDVGRAAAHGGRQPARRGIRYDVCRNDCVPRVTRRRRRARTIGHMSRSGFLVFVVFGSRYSGLHFYIWARLVRDTALPPPFRALATGALIALGLVDAAVVHPRARGPSRCAPRSPGPRTCGWAS